jgi:hypothetical protein
VQIETELGHRTEVGTEPGGDDHLIDLDRLVDTVGLTGHGDPAVADLERLDAERGDDPDVAGVDSCFGAFAERTPARQLVVVQSAERPLGRC